MLDRKAHINRGTPTREIGLGPTKNHRALKELVINLLEGDKDWWE